MMRRLALFGVMAVVVSGSAVFAARGGATEVRVLDTYSYWRCWIYWHPVVVGESVDDVKPGPKASKHHPVSLPPAKDWMKPSFDDSDWWRNSGAVSGGYGFGTEYIGAIYLRGKFRVKDPSAVKGMKLSLRFRGGAVVYVNGKEVARKHLKEGTVSADTLAEPYPLEVYCQPGEKKIIRWGWNEPRKFKDRVEKRIRRLDVEIPSELLVKGVNVVAVEIHRAPYHPAYFRLGKYWAGKWSTCGFVGLSLTAAAGSAVEPNVKRPAGIRLWNAVPSLSVFDVDYGDPCEDLRPVRLVAARNGVGAGVFVIGSDKPIEQVKVSVKGLEKAGIPSDNVHVWYAVAGKWYYGKEKNWYSRYAGIRGPVRLDFLVPSPPSVVKPASKRVDGWRRDTFSPVAVLPVWVVVDVPKDAKAGKYKFSLGVEVGGEKFEVPAEFAVCGFVLPSPRKYLSHVGLVQSPDSVALWYKVPLWSDKHWKLMESSLKLMGRMGCKVVYVPLIARTNFGNDQSMVVWRKEKDGSLKPDFSIMDKYLDMWEKYVGKPDVVCFYVWELYAGGGYFGGKSKKVRGVDVTVVDDNGKAELHRTPVFGTPESEKFWKPVFDALRERMHRRGLKDDNIMIGIASDTRPSKTVTDFFLKIAPYAKWVLHSHGAATRIGKAKVGYYCHVWGVKFCNDPDEPDRFTRKGRWYGWKESFRKCVFPRVGQGAIMRALHPDSELGTYRALMEAMFVCGYRGFGRVGADFWPVLAHSHGNNTGREITARYITWHQLNMNTATCAVFHPGPKGALPTTRSLNMLLGIEEAEARAFVEGVLIDKDARAAVGEKLALEAQRLLDLRTRIYRVANSTQWWNWFGGSGVESRREALFQVAGKIQEKVRK